MRPVEVRFKRILDVFLSACGLVVVTPLLASVAAAIALLDGLPVLYVATRVGLKGRPIRVLKFRTMSPGSESRGPGVTSSGDPRITSVGRFLRVTKLDELPQLINVLRGEMSLVGPRPEDPRYVARYTNDQRRLFEVRPGLTSIASLQYVDEELLLTGENPEALYVEKVLPEKLSMELEYLRTQSVQSDLRIMGMTLVSVFGKRLRGGAQSARATS
jgi:lipopolysaccharide/colanic/teichoic acid biosynthesis glycosyltransferase